MNSPEKVYSARPRKRRRRNLPGGSADADLFLPLPPSDFMSGRGILVQKLSRRLVQAGYGVAAFTHTVYGKPKKTVDAVDEALPIDDLFVQQNNGKSKIAPELTVLRRLHSVIENLADVGSFVKQSANSEEVELLKEYDIVSIAPRNEAAFRSVIASATECDIITLDYTVQKSGLPFRVRPTDIRIMVERQLVLEIPYAPALLNPSWRKSWIQTCAEIQQASRGQDVKLLLLSSGDRKMENVKDAAALAIRMPRDLHNLAMTILGFQNLQATGGAVSKYALARAQKRRTGTNIIECMYFGEMEVDQGNAIKEDPASSFVQKIKSKQKETAKTADNEVCSDDDDEEDAKSDLGDGFIAL